MGIVTQAVGAGAVVETCVVAPSLRSNATGWELARSLRVKGVPVVEISDSAFASISFKEDLQGIGAVVRLRTDSLDQVVPDDSLGWVALSDVGNPGNLGAVLRTCDAVGCAGLILLGDTVDPYHPAALRASRGTIFSQRVVRATFARFDHWKQTHGYTVVGTSPDADRAYRDVEYGAPLVLLMGSERHGLPAEHQAVCDTLVRIPMVGRADSLNLAVATSVLLYEVFHQRNATPAPSETRSRPAV